MLAVKERSKNLNQMGRLFKLIVSEIFKASILGYLLFYLIDNIKPGYISDFLNYDFLIIIALISGLTTVICEDGNFSSNHDSESMPKRSIIIISIFLGIISFVMVWQTVKEMGRISYLISIASGIIIILVSILLLSEPPEEGGEEKEKV